MSPTIENRCIENPVVPCAMTGACAVLSGFSGLNVIIHGPSGCYYYPKSILKTPLYSTLLVESDVVLGSVERLKSVISDLKSTGYPVAVVNTCVPALAGDDLSGAVDGIFVDAPGFVGNAEKGAKIAYEALNINVINRDGINIDGICSLDLFSRGNLYEMNRLLTILGIPVAVTFASDRYQNIMNGASPYSVSANPSWNSGVGENLGSFLFSELTNSIDNLMDKFPNSDYASINAEVERADELMFYYADKYLRKYSPPVTAVVSQKSYCDFALWILNRYLGADVPLILPREEYTDYTEINSKINDIKPELILGSTFESLSYKDAAFFGITYPDRSRVSIAGRTIVGLEGAMNFLENIINASIDHNIIK